jgi:hypothetical protein
MATPSIAGIYENEIVSLFDVVKPDILSKIYKRYGDQGQSWLLDLNQMGFLKPVANDEYSHYEDDLVNPTINVRTGVAQPSAGADLVFTLATANLDANNRFYPRLWQIVFFKGGKSGIISDIDVSSPSAPVLTISPLDATYQLPGVATGEEVSLISNAHSEGSDQPKGAVKGAVKRTNHTQIIKETITSTGSQLTTQTWFDGWMDASTIGGSEQIAGGKSWYNMNFMDMEIRFAMQTSGALLMGEESDGSVIDPVTNRPIYTTKGLVPTIKEYGNEISYTPGATTIADFDSYDRVLEREYAGDFVMGLFSNNYCNEFENALVSFLANTNIDYVGGKLASAYGAEARGVAVNFDYLKKGNRTFMYRRMREFSNRQTFGINGSVVESYGLLIPCGKIKDAKSNKMVSNVGARYKALDGYSRKSEIWVQAGAGPGQKVLSADIHNTFMRGEFGAHTMGANQMILLSA